MAMFFVVVVLTLVASPIIPRENAFTLHLVADPVAGEFSPVGPLVLAVTVDVVVYEVSFV